MSVAECNRARISAACPPSGPAGSRTASRYAGLRDLVARVMPPYPFEQVRIAHPGRRAHVAGDRAGPQRKEVDQRFAIEPRPHPVTALRGAVALVELRGQIEGDRAHPVVQHPHRDALAVPLAHYVLATAGAQIGRGQHGDRGREMHLARRALEPVEPIEQGEQLERLVGVAGERAELHPERVGLIPVDAVRHRQHGPAVRLDGVGVAADGETRGSNTWLCIAPMTSL
ncbi:hypothetical protein Asp14428_33560 [Actinoplanes sp. NBRC 14428]|nr:hypothetical protein Asp14428_33560 [Actinoplanes sp. NBRC 14428]